MATVDRKWLLRTLRAMRLQTDPGRLNLGGAWTVEHGGTNHLYTTDGHRAYRAVVPHEMVVNADAETLNRWIAELGKSKSEIVTVTATNDLVLDGKTLPHKVPEGFRPNVRAVWPNYRDSEHATLDEREFRLGVERAWASVKPSIDELTTFDKERRAEHRECIRRHNEKKLAAKHTTFTEPEVSNRLRSEILKEEADLRVVRDANEAGTTTLQVEFCKDAQEKIALLGSVLFAYKSIVPEEKPGNPLQAKTKTERQHALRYGDRIAVPATGCAQPNATRVLFNTKYLSHAAAAFRGLGQIQIALGDAFAPMQMRTVDGSFEAVVMPLRK